MISEMSVFNRLAFRFFPFEERERERERVRETDRQTETERGERKGGGRIMSGVKQLNPLAFIFFP